MKSAPIVLRGDARLAAIAASLANIAPIKLQQLRKVDPLTFEAISARLFVVSIVAPLLSAKRLSQITIEVSK